MPLDEPECPPDCVVVEVEEAGEEEEAWAAWEVGAGVWLKWAAEAWEQRSWEAGHSLSLFCSRAPA